MTGLPGTVPFSKDHNSVGNFADTAGATKIDHSFDNSPYTTYSGADIIATMSMPGGETHTIGELQTISYSIHRENTPVRFLGKAGPVAFVRGGRCLPSSERVLVRGKGYISIADVKTGDFVQSTATSYNRVVGSYDQGEKLCFNLRLQNGYEIKASYDHPIYTDRGWVKMSELTYEDKVHTVGKTLAEEKDYPIKDEVLKLIALLIGNGTTQIYEKQNGSKEYRVALAIGEMEMDTIGVESEHLLNSLHIPFRDTTNTCINRSISVCEEGHAKTDWRKRKYNELHETLIRYDLYGKYSYQKIIPQEFLAYLSKRQIALFLNYLFSTDGGYSVEKKGKKLTILYSSTSEELVDGIRLLLNKLGVIASKTKRDLVGKVGGRGNIIHRHDSFTLRIKDSLNVLKFIKRIGIFGKDSRILPLLPSVRSRITHSYLSVSAKEFSEMVRVAVFQSEVEMSDVAANFNIYNYSRGMTPRRALKIASFIQNSDLLYQVNDLIEELIDKDEDYISLKVTSLEEIGTLQVYDLEVEDRHTFISEFIKVHNTIAGSMIFTVFNTYAFYKIKCMADRVNNNQFSLADQLPPFDITITFSNEYGSFSKMRILGITIVDEGGTMSVDDLMIEQTYTFMARDIEPIIAYKPGYLSEKSNATYTDDVQDPDNVSVRIDTINSRTSGSYQ